MSQPRSFYRRMLSPVMVFGVVVFAVLLLHIGYATYERERSSIQEYTALMMESLVLDLDSKTKSTEAVILAESHAGNFRLCDTAAVFRKLSNFVGDDNFISNVCLEVWNEKINNPEDFNELFYVGRELDGSITSRHLFIRDIDSDEVDKAGFLEAERTGSVAWSGAYYDSLFCKSMVLTCYKICEDPGMVLSADLELSTLLENLDSLQIYEGSIMCVRTSSGEAYASDGGKIIRVDGMDYDSDHNILFSTDYPTLDLEILSVVPKKEIYDHMWSIVALVFIIFNVILIILALLVHRTLNKVEKELTESVRKAAGEEMALKKIEDDLAIAARLQTRMLVSPGKGVHIKPEDCRAADIMSRLIPAREVGGDLYEYRLMGDNLVICIGDVSGKGIPASVMMTMSCTLFHAYQPQSQTPDPAELLDYLNAQLCRRNEQMMFVTMWVGVLDLRSGALKYASAGHNPPVLISDSAVFLKTKNGTPLGLFEAAVYRNSLCTLAPNDSILIYTDGITEAEDTQRRLFGETALLELCGQMISHSPQYICNKVLCAVRDHASGAQQSDDITLMCVTFDGRIAQLHDVEDVMALHNLAEECGGGFRTALALEELAVNAFTHGEAGFVSASFADGIYTLIDDGGEFDPTTYASAPDQDDELNIGGRGIDLVRKVSQLFVWRREGRYNITQLKIEESI